MSVLNGIDVSNHQGTAFPWTSYKGQISYAFIKATEGLNYLDPDYPRNVAGAESIGAIPGAYHFLHAGLDGAAQARYFLAYAKPKAGQLVALDVEQSGQDGRPASTVAACAAAFAAVIQHECGAWPVVYTDIAFAVAGYLNGLSTCPLWLANPSAVPTGSGVGPWKLISFEQTGQRSDVDADVFYGDLAALKRLTITHAAGSAPAPPPAPKPAAYTPIPLNLTGCYTDATGALYMVGTDAEGRLCESKRSAPGHWGIPYPIAGKAGV